MSKAFRVYSLVMIGVLSVFMAGCGGDDNPAPPALVEFVAATPPSGSTIEPDATITVTFDAAPGNVVVNRGAAITTGQTVTISGPFDAGLLSLGLAWADGFRVLNYTVEPPTPVVHTVEPPTPVAPEGMVLIPAGEFQMGSNAPEAENDEQPVHTVYLDAFFMDEYEVTNLEYKQFVLANPLWRKDRIDSNIHDEDYLKHWSGNDYPGGKANHPVVYVSWYAAAAYAKWVGKRLPTEAEWEKAARGGLSGKVYPWGNVIDTGKANYGRNIGDTTAVGRYPPNGYGLYDMAGNVWEWCLDEYNHDFYFSSPRRNPLSGAHSVEWIMDNFIIFKTERVLRGGSWYGNPEFLRVADRLRVTTPTYTNSDVGFRCVRAQ